MKYLILIPLLLLSGCFVLWTDDVFVGTIFKTADVDGLELMADPNGIQIGSGQSRTENDKLKVIAPAVGIIETE